jgi:hypothetical protein
MRILLDPGHEHAIGLLLLVPAPTGITYCHQVNGHAVELREAEGFLIPLACADDAAAFSDWFRSSFRGWSRPEDWTDELYMSLDTLLNRIVSYGEDKRQRLSLDASRREEATEGWIPVHSALGPAYLLFENSD